MTVSTTSASSDLYTHDGVEDTFTFPFNVKDDELVAVYLSDDGGLTEVLIDPADYVVTINSSPPGGQIVWDSVAGYTSAHTFRIVRETAKKQTLKITNTSDLHPESIEAALDEHVRMIQEVSDRVLRLPPTSADDPDAFVSQLVAIRNQQVPLQTGRVLLDEVDSLSAPVIYAAIEASEADIVSYSRLELEIEYLRASSASVLVELLRGASEWTAGAVEYRYLVVSAAGAVSGEVDSPGNTTIPLLFAAARTMFGSMWVVSHDIESNARGWFDLRGGSGSNFSTRQGSFEWASAENAVPVRGVRFFTDRVTADVAAKIRLWGWPKN